jgi:hypothetical protein
MRSISFIVCAILILIAPLPSVAKECWAVSNIKGYAAYADSGYKFIKDGLPNTILLCFGEKEGTVTGTDTRFVKFGASTLAGYGGHDQGNELFEVYQIDRQNKKLLYTKSRIGTKTVAPIFSDVVMSLVGDAVQVSR